MGTDILMPDVMHAMPVPDVLNLYYSAEKVMLTVAFTINFAAWTTVPASSFASAVSILMALRFPALFS